LSADNTHFSKDKQSSTFKFPQEVGPFREKGKGALSIVEKALKDMDLDKDIRWKYDPYDSVAKLKRMKKGNISFHEKNEQLEKITNKLIKAHIISWFRLT